ncbi:unnamed protein product [Ilex paraguariensis]|uniref:WW domain-containing protein n=1 Tax=Ilex paraguariensis TaxID=185542 RepID=A0ABC8RV90_9AQUA
MGRRKERRLAAMGATNRRVKLALFTEPSGDLGGSPVQVEVGGNDDSKNSAELPNSPSSSGQQPENPLLLLGQYSDDELDEESTKGLDHAIVENSSADLDDQAKVAVGKECDTIEVNGGKEHISQKAEQLYIDNGSASGNVLQKLDENGTGENEATESADLHRETDSKEQISISATCDIQVGGDVSSGWKVVLHEESNQYYYWNTETGETSWEVPDVLAKGTGLTCEQKTAADIEGSEIAVAVAKKLSSTLDIELDETIARQPSDGYKDANPNGESEHVYEPRPEMEVSNEEQKGDILDDKRGYHDVNENDVKYSGAMYHETSSPGNYVSSGQSGDALLGVEQERGTDVPFRLVKHSECLLETLRSLKRSKCHLQVHDLVAKYILEVEIRLSDIKSLLSYGSSLLPFWVHSERQLKQLEASMNEEVIQFPKSVQMSEVQASHYLHGSTGDGIQSDLSEKKIVICTSEGSHASEYASTIPEVQKDACTEAYTDAAVNAEQDASTGYITIHSASGAGGKEELDGAAIHAETLNAVLHSGEDVDMDVDMEVEDEIPASNTNIPDASVPQYLASPEQPGLANLSSQLESFTPEEAFGVPPPPDEDWIPPPPPDGEPFPPPPPDEPPENSYPPLPSDLETVPPFAYTGHYNLSYPDSNYEYYVPTNGEALGSNFYAHANGSQIAVSHPLPYYEAVAPMYPGAAPVVVNPVEPFAYYGLQDGTVPPVPVVSSAESSGFHCMSGHESLGPDQIVSLEAHAVPCCTSLSNTKTDVSAAVGETEKEAVKVPSAPASVQASATISAMECVSMSSIPAVPTVSAATATVPKVQSKVPRKKQRTVGVVSTLRSNKKVSSLVDKWKAAKEELHEEEEEEDEPENAYEMLEKKRQREIEKWRAKQVASGEAKDNANFQPLGGDWYGP